MCPVKPLGLVVSLMLPYTECRNFWWYVSKCLVFCKYSYVYAPLQFNPLFIWFIVIPSSTFISSVSCVYLSIEISESNGNLSVTKYRISTIYQRGGNCFPITII